MSDIVSYYSQLTNKGVMRKILFGALLSLLMLSSCNSNDEGEQTKFTGSLNIKPQVNIEGIEVIPTRLAAQPDLYLQMSIPGAPPFISWKKLSEIPNGVIEDIPVGDYQISLLSHTHDFIPAFDAPFYEGHVGVQIKKDTQQDVTIDCIQTNAGIRFIYDSSLEAGGFGGMFVEIHQDGMGLIYSGDDKERTGYFHPGSVSISFRGPTGAPYFIGTETEKKLALKSQQLWEITLKAAPKNSINMVVNIKTVGKPTDYDEFTISKYAN